MTAKSLNNSEEKHVMHNNYMVVLERPEWKDFVQQSLWIIVLDKSFLNTNYNNELGNDKVDKIIDEKDDIDSYDESSVELS